MSDVTTSATSSSLRRGGRGTAPRSPGWVALDCLTAVAALHLAFFALAFFPVWLGLAFAAFAGVTLFFAVREVFLWLQHLANLRAARSRTELGPGLGPAGPAT